MFNLSAYKEEWIKKTNIKIKGLHTGFNRFEKYSLGALEGNYVLIGGSSGSGKTTLIDYILLSICKSAKERNIPIKILYYSLEIPKDRKIAKFVSLILLSRYKIELSDMDILNRTDVDINEFKEKIYECYDIVSNYLDNVQFTFEAINPTQVYKDLINIRDNNKNIENKPQVYVFLDHIKLLKTERGFSIKETMDKMSEYAVYFRNTCNYSFYILQQFNRSITNIDRVKYSGVDLMPNREDFADTSTTYFDSDQVFATFNPSIYNLPDCLGYQLYNFKGFFRALFILKNRFGEENKGVGVFFKGKCNYMKELPLPSELNDNDIKQLIK